MENPHPIVLFKRYNARLLGSLAALVVIAAAINVRVNPWRVLPNSVSDPKLDAFRDYSQRMRTGKAGLLRYGDYSVALVGSSRIANAFDPHLPEWQRDSVVNLGCSAAFLKESVLIARNFIESQPAQLLILGVDPGDLTSEVDTRPLMDFPQSPFSPRSGIENEISYWVGPSAVRSSFLTLQNARKREPARYGPDGVPRSARESLANQVAFIASTLENPNPLDTFDAAGPGRPLNCDKLKSLKELLQTAAQHSCRVIILYHASHALMHGQLEDRGNAIVPFETERRTIVRLISDHLQVFPEHSVAFWDFCNHHPLSCEPIPFDRPETGRLENWRDLGHYRAVVGHQMLALMLGWLEPRPEWHDIGKVVTPRNLEAHLQEVAGDYQGYLNRTGIRDLEWKAKLRSGNR